MKKRRPRSLPKRKNAVLSPAARPGRISGKTSAAARKAPLIVGVGASAGGLEAFTQLLHALPTDTGMAFVLVQHLEPSRESVLTKLLARATEMPVQEVREGMRAEPDHVYVIPANADLSLMDGLLHIVERKAPAGHHLPIDYFFRSLAQTRKAQAIGVILSGTASDGTAGLHAIKAEGGITLAQEPASARFDGMPRSAIAAGCVDLVLPPERIAAELARLARHPFVALLPQDAVPALPAKEEDWARLFRLLRTSTGVDFTFYKKSTIKRRLARRMTLHKIESMSEYLKLLEDSREEIDAIFREILIQVTSFFREPEVFHALAGKVFPALLAGKPPAEAIRIWVPGCSSGEEVYSIAICLLEHLGDHGGGTPIQIFGTDISDTAIEKARAGVYPADALREVSPERLRRFFTPVEGGYEINPNVREICVFARHDVTKDPPFSRLDLIGCRNLLIYFEPILQRKVLASFHYALKSTGMLLLGKSETLGAFTDLFTIADRKNKFFTKNAAAALPYQVIASSHGGLALPHGKQGREAIPGLELEREVDRVVWETYAHAGMVVNNDLQVLHYRGDVSPYVQPLAGKATFDLMRMVREELQLELRAAIQKARRTGTIVRREGIELRQDLLVRQVNVEVHPLPASAAHEKCFLILFEQASLRSEPPAEPAGGKRKDKAIRDRELRKLRNELERARDDLQAVIREQETTNEELKTANEEAMSSMEELQSTNEELETAKEELQSSNEELITLNEQLENRNAEMGQITDDLSNVLSGVDIPILILDRARCIRRFTPPAQKLLSLLPGDVGRPIRNLRMGVAIPDLEELIAAAIGGSAEIRRDVRSEEGRWYSLRVRAFRTGENKIEGVLMAFVDIHELKQNQDHLMKERNFISAILDAAKDLLVVVLDREGRIVQFNRVCQQLTGYSVEEVMGRRPWDFLLLPDEAPAVKETFNKVLRGESCQSENSWVAKDGQHLLIAWSNTAASSDGEVESVIATGIDRTERAEARQRAQASESTIRALMETSAQAILAINQQGQIVFANGTTDRMFGYGHEELVSQPIEKLMPERFRARHSEHLARWFSQPRNRQMGAELELFGLRKDGTEFPVDVGLSYIQTAGEVLGVSFVSDVSERKRNEKALLDYQKRLQDLTANLMNVQEADNKELARELHDVFSQELAALGMEVSTLRASHEVADPMRLHLAKLGEKIRHLADQMHDQSRRLHPQILHELGLEAALHEECDKFSEHAGIPVGFTCEELPASLSEDVALCLYRVAQESLLNIRKHAGATDAQVDLRVETGGVRLIVADTGDGFDVNDARKRGGLGLTSMEERVRIVNGKFTIQSRPGSGTRVEVFVPLGEKAA